MKDINRLVIEGRLTRGIGEKDFKAFSTGTQVLNFPIANNYYKKQGDEWVEEASYFDVVVFGKQAESLRDKLHKGTRVFVEGVLRQERWQAQDGTKKSAVRVYADVVKFERVQQAESYMPPAATQYEARTVSGDEFIDDVPF